MLRVPVTVRAFGVVASAVSLAAWLQGPGPNDSELTRPARDSTSPSGGPVPGSAAPSTRSLDLANFPPTTPAFASTAPGPIVAAIDSSPRTSEWPTAVLQDPDPRVRRQALEDWARDPRKSLDLPSAMMVDPDETIRERARQVFEEALTRR